MSIRGLRQDDPSYPLCFVIAADTFARMLNLAAAKGGIQGLGPDGMSEKVLSLQYDDNNPIFCKAEDGYLRMFKLLLYGYELASGLQINFNISFVYLLNEDECGGNFSPQTIGRLRSNLPKQTQRKIQNTNTKKITWKIPSMRKG